MAFLSFKVSSRNGFKLIGSILALYFCGAFIYLFILCFPSTQEGLTALQNGEQQLASPSQRSQAAISFNQASSAFETNFRTLQSLPFPIKILTPLPPFRWQVRFLKASHSLALAGQEASQLSTSFPSLTPQTNSDLNSLAKQTSQTYYQWYFANQPSIQRLQTDLQASQTDFKAVPSWTLFTQKGQFEQLRSQVTEVNQQLALADTLSRQLATVFGKEDGEKHIFLLTDPFILTPTDPLLQIKTEKGLLEQISASSLNLPTPSNLSPFFAQAATQIADSSQKEGQPLAGIISLDNQTRTALFLLDQGTGPTPPLTQFLADLINKAANNPLLFSKLLTLLEQALQQKSLQIWSSNPALEQTLEAQLPADLPLAGHNWLKVVSQTTKGKEVSVSQQSLSFKDNIQETVTIQGENQPLKVYLPLEASQISGGGLIETNKSQGWNAVNAFNLPITITYTLPYTNPNLHSFLYLKQSGTEQDRLKADDFHYIGPITHNLILTK